MAALAAATFAAQANAAFVAGHPDAAPAAKECREVIVPSDDDDLEQRLAGVDPEKVARVKAAIAAKAKKAAQKAQDSTPETTEKEGE